MDKPYSTSKYARTLIGSSKVEIILQSNRQNSRFAPLDLHMLNAFVGFGLGCIASNSMLAKQKSFFTFEPREKWGKGKKVKEVG